MPLPATFSLYPANPSSIHVSVKRSALNQMCDNSCDTVALSVSSVTVAVFVDAL